MDHKEGYLELVNAILQAKINSFGELAKEIAQELGDLQVDAHGAVTDILGEPKLVIHTLLARFEKIGGHTSTITARVYAVSVLQKYPDLSLPEELAA